MEQVAMIPFAAPTEDILFSMRIVAAAADLPGWDDDLVQDILQAFGTFAEAEIAPINASGDRAGCSLENGRVRMPDGFAKVYRQLAAMGWQGLTAPRSLWRHGTGATGRRHGVRGVFRGEPRPSDGLQSGAGRNRHVARLRD